MTTKLPRTPAANLVRDDGGIAVRAWVFELASGRWRLLDDLNAREGVAFGALSFVDPGGSAPPREVPS